MGAERAKKTRGNWAKSYEIQKYESNYILRHNKKKMQPRFCRVIFERDLYRSISEIATGKLSMLSMK